MTLCCLAIVALDDAAELPPAADGTFELRLELLVELSFANMKTEAGPDGLWAVGASRIVRILVAWLSV
jgi:hypothetical protein